MIPPAGEYRYEIRRTGETPTREETTFERGKIFGWRQSLEGTNRNEVEAEISPQGLVVRVRLRYVRGPFSRTASYEAGDDFLRGSVSALGGRNAVTARLGRFHEVSADFLLFRALTLGHVRERQQTRWTGRVVTIDSATLVATSNKQSARAVDDRGLKWIYEPRMGDLEEIEIDPQGRVLCRRDNRGGEATLVVG